MRVKGSNRFFIQNNCIYHSKLPELFSNGKESLTVYSFVLIFKKNFTLSHTPQRKEKDCLNCGATVQGRYCHVCGQENVEPKETFWYMVTHFFNDITHFDGSFFVTLKDLLFKPGFLSREYMKGRRASYLHPVRMYVFTSAIFFLLFFSLVKSKDAIEIKNAEKPLDAKQRADYIISLQNKLKKDTANILLKERITLFKDTSRPLTVKDIFETETNQGLNLTFGGKAYKTFREYDSIQQTLPPSERDGWFLRRIIKKGIDINNKYHENPSEALNKLGESILHRLPYMLFVSLPLFALILRLVYIRRKWRREFYFADHGVFTIHLYIFSFILLMLVFGLNSLQRFTGWSFIGVLIFILFVGLLFYLYKAMRKFYGQGRVKTFLKFLFVSFWSLIMMIILLAIFMFFSVATL